MLRCWSVSTGSLVASWAVDGPQLPSVARAMAWGVSPTSDESGLWYSRDGMLLHLPIC